MDVSSADTDTFTKIVSDHWKGEVSKSCQKERDRVRSARGGLGEAASRTVNRLLSEDGYQNLRAVLNGHNPTALHRLMFKDGMLPYPIYRAYKRLLARSLVPDIEAAGTDTSLSISEAVVRNDEYLRTVSQPDDLYLLSCTGLADILVREGASRLGSSQTGNFIKFKRRYSSPWKLPTLAQLRCPEISLRSSDESFREAFGTGPRGILRGLDWANIMIIGSAVLETLCVAVPESQNPAPKIELVLYGLSSETADAKLQHIYDIWMNNRQYSEEGSVHRGPHEIVLKPRLGGLAVGSETSITIFTKIYRHKTDALLDIAQDSLAIGFDGNGVLMLPRCALAIETGCDLTTERTQSAQSAELATQSTLMTNGRIMPYAAGRWTNSIADGRTYFEEYMWPFVNARTRTLAQRYDFVNYLTGRATTWRLETDLSQALRRSLKWPLWLTKELEDMVANSLPAGVLIPAYDAKAHAAGSDYQGILPPLPEVRSSNSVGNLRYLVFKPSYWRGLHVDQDRAMELLLMVSSIQLQTEVGRFEDLGSAQLRFSEALQMAKAMGHFPRF